ncbi:hypothetical protein RGU75_11110 [Glaciimonas sp. CA11.2]|nr:hypothetical protein [Glaciimonas sp. CA11.2]MDY7546777.1 hypothetical protein [Glaciimonas sp. CA11.2]
MVINNKMNKKSALWAQICPSEVQSVEVIKEQWAAHKSHLPKKAHYISSTKKQNGLFFRSRTDHCARKARMLGFVLSC